MTIKPLSYDFRTGMYVYSSVPTRNTTENIFTSIREANRASSSVTGKKVNSTEDLLLNIKKEYDIKRAAETGAPIIEPDGKGGYTLTYYGKDLKPNKVAHAGADGKVTSYELLDSQGNTTNKGVVTYNDGGIQEKVYDAAGKVLQNEYITNSDNTKQERTYHSNGKIKSQTFLRANGLKKEDAAYDTQGRKTSFTKYDANGTPEHQVTRVYNSDGTVTETDKDASGKKIEVHKYDKNENLTEKTIYGANEKVVEIIKYTYASNGSIKETRYKADGKTKIDEKIYNSAGEAIGITKLDNADGSAGAWGDPHFQFNGRQAFDFMGKIGGTYSMLDNEDITLVSRFGQYGNNGATIIQDQNLEFDGTGVNIVSHANGTFEIYADGVKIGDQSTFKTDAKVKEVLDFYNINVQLQNNILTTVYNNRRIEQQLNGGYIDNGNVTRMVGDTGLLSQTAGALDKDGNIDGETRIDLNGNGIIEANEIFKYNLSNQIATYTDVYGFKCNPITPEIRAAILADYEAGKAKGSPILGRNFNHGYDARQWNEVLLEIEYGVTDNPFLK